MRHSVRSELSQQLAADGVPHWLVREPDPPWNGAAMAIGIVPAVRTPTLRRALGRLPLLR
jgi:hypothetical protein